MANNDRLFIDRFDNFIFTIRNILYFGDTKSDVQPKNPKHDRLRFINYFSNEKEYYSASEKLIDFSDNTDLKDVFADIYTYKAMSTSEMGDSFQLFSRLEEDSFMNSAQLLSGSARNPKNFNRRIEKGSELAQSGSLVIENTKPIKYKLNTDICKGLTREERKQFVNALNFAIKKNNFSAFASTLKKAVCCTYSIFDEDDSISIDHQLFHPILDEFHLWSAISAISEGLNISVDYCPQNSKGKETVRIEKVLPLKIVYDALYGRSYLFVFDCNSDTMFPIRLDRVFHMDFSGDADKKLYSEKVKRLEELLKTAWTVSINPKTERVEIEFNNLPHIRYRVENECRHGRITHSDESRFTYEIDVNDSFEMTNWVLSFGENCRVKQPQRLIEKIVAHFEGIIK